MSNAPYSCLLILSSALSTLLLKFLDNLSICYCILQLQTFCLVIFDIFHLFVSILILFMHRFLSSLSTSMNVALYTLSNNSYTFFFFLGSVSENLFHSFNWTNVYTCLTFFVILCWHLYIWKSSCLFHSLWMALYKDWPSPVSLAKDSGGLSNLFCRCVFSGCVNVDSD